MGSAEGSLICLISLDVHLHLVMANHVSISIEAEHWCRVARGVAYKMDPAPVNQWVRHKASSYAAEPMASSILNKFSHPLTLRYRPGVPPNHMNCQDFVVIGCIEAP